MAFVALLDANVLYPAALRDVLLSIAKAGICQIRWSADILDEMQRNVANRAKAEPAAAAQGAAYLRRTMELAFPDAMVKRTAYDSLVASMTNHPKDRHVLAAAIAGRADVIVTFNVKDFPQESVLPYAIEVQEPDTYLIHQFGLGPSRLLKILGDLAANRREPMNSPERILATLRSQAPQFCQMALEGLNGQVKS